MNFDELNVMNCFWNYFFVYIVLVSYEIGAYNHSPIRSLLTVPGMDLMISELQRVSILLKK